MSRGRADDDFWAYVAARWPALVRGLVEQGATPDRAHDLAAEALSRCRRRWAAASRDGDVDALVADELAALWRPRAPSSVEVSVRPPPTPEDLAERDRRRRARTTRRALAVLVPLVLVAAGGTWWATRDAPPEPEREQQVLPDTEVERAENPLPVAWYAAGELHLPRVTVRVDDLVDLTARGAGALYGDAQGRVVAVGDDGSRLVLGRKDPDQPVVATDETGLAAWVDTSEDDPVLVVAEGGERVGELDVDAGTTVIAVDGRSVFFRDDLGARVWLPDGGSAVLPVTPAELVDVRSRIRAFQLDPATLQVVQSSFDVAFSLAGSGARLSPDGNTVATRLDQSGYGRLALYDARSGEALWTGLQGAEVALAVSLGERQSVTYVVAQAADMRTTGPFLRSFAGGDLTVRQCDLAEEACTDVVRLPDATEVPVLAR